jgi:hypothetical protein
MRRVTFVLIVAATALAGCGSKQPRTPTAAESRRMIERVFQAHLPESATNVRADSDEVFTLVVYGSFQCSQQQLQTFLSESKLLPDQLRSGTNPLAGIQSGRSWWHPEQLNGVSGVKCDWEAGQDFADCYFAAGSAGADDVLVYFMVVYENKGQTAFRSEVKADPNWTPQTRPGKE